LQCSCPKPPLSGAEFGVFPIKLTGTWVNHVTDQQFG
jgi:hypothetical protein